LPQGVALSQVDRRREKGKLVAKEANFPCLCERSPSLSFLSPIYTLPRHIGVLPTMSQDEKTPLLINESINGDGEEKVVIKPIYEGNNKVLLWINGIYVNARKGFSLKLFLMLLGLIFVGTANRVAFKIMSNSTLLRVRYDEKGKLVVNPKYSTFIAQVTNFIYMPVFWPIVWYFMAKTNRCVKPPPYSPLQPAHALNPTT
jgi:hypothetical protein